MVIMHMQITYVQCKSTKTQECAVLVYCIQECAIQNLYTACMNWKRHIWQLYAPGSHF